MNAADFGECFDYDMFIRCLGSLRASASGTRRGMFLLIVRYRCNFKLTLSCRNAMLVAEIVVEDRIPVSSSLESRSLGRGSCSGLRQGMF